MLAAGREFFSAEVILRWLLSPVSGLELLGGPYTTAWFAYLLIFALTFIGWLAALHSLRGVSASKRFLSTKAELIDAPANPMVERYAPLFKVVLKLCLAYVGASLIGTLCLAAVTEAHAQRPLSLLIIFPVIPYLQLEMLIGGGRLLQEEIYFWISFVVSLVALLLAGFWSRR